MITVEKDGIRTQVLELFKEKYLLAGWKVIETKTKIVEDEAEEIISLALNSKQSATSRKRNVVNDKDKEAEAIVATELKEKEETTFTDDLIKE